MGEYENMADKEGSITHKSKKEKTEIAAKLYALAIVLLILFGYTAIPMWFNNVTPIFGVPQYVFVTYLIYPPLTVAITVIYAYYMNGHSPPKEVRGEVMKEVRL
jgi:uncharacterized RDD family membrane protein YckC